MASEAPPLRSEWELAASSTLGSALRTKGIERELRRRLPWSARKALSVDGARASLTMTSDKVGEFESATDRISAAMDEIPSLAVLPSEAEEILTITSSERHRWTKDGRLQSAGTRTVKLRGRSKAVTFHVFDPRHIENVLDRDLPLNWREDDARTRAENRKRAAAKAALARADKRKPQPTTEPGHPEAPGLEGWDAFVEEGLLR